MTISGRVRGKTFALAGTLAIGLGSLLGNAAPAVAAQDQPGYWLAGGDGGVFSYGSAGFDGSETGAGVRVVGMDTDMQVATGGEPGYELVTNTGQVFTCNLTCRPGRDGSLPAGADSHIVGIATMTGGYWLVDASGNVYPFGNSTFGSLADVHLGAPIVGIAATPDDGGYWLVAADGGVFAFGDAAYYGSLGGTRLNQPVVGIAAVPSGGGYWLVAADGGVFSFGGARFYGSTGDVHLKAPVVGIRPSPDGGGYWLVASDGGCSPTVTPRSSAPQATYVSPAPLSAWPSSATWADPSAHPDCETTGAALAHRQPPRQLAPCWITRVLP